MHLVAARCLQGELQRIGNVFSPHVGAKLPGHDVAAVIIKDCAEIEPAPTEDFDVCEVGLPKLIDGCRFVFELVGGLAHVLEDVIDEYVSVGRAELDYGLVIKVNDADMLDYEIDVAGTEAARAHIRANRVAWARTDPEEVAQMYKDGKINEMDAVRKYAVILDWGTGELMPISTGQFRESYERRSVAHWT